MTKNLYLLMSSQEMKSAQTNAANTSF